MLYPQGLRSLLSSQAYLECVPSAWGKGLRIKRSGHNTCLKIVRLENRGRQSPKYCLKSPETWGNLRQKSNLRFSDLPMKVVRSLKTGAPLRHSGEALLSEIEATPTLLNLAREERCYKEAQDQTAYQTPQPH